MKMATKVTVAVLCILATIFVTSPAFAQCGFGGCGLGGCGGCVRLRSRAAVDP